MICKACAETYDAAAMALCETGLLVLTVTELGQVLGVTRAALWKRRTGKVGLNPEAFHAIRSVAQIYGRRVVEMTCKACGNFKVGVE